MAKKPALPRADFMNMTIFLPTVAGGLPSPPGVAFFQKFHFTTAVFPTVIDRHGSVVFSPFSSFQTPFF